MRPPAGLSQAPHDTFKIDVRHFQRGNSEQHDSTPSSSNGAMPGTGKSAAALDYHKLRPYFLEGARNIGAAEGVIMPTIIDAGC
jgi:hypothetical protein